MFFALVEEHLEERMDHGVIRALIAIEFLIGGSEEGKSIKEKMYICYNGTKKRKGYYGMSCRFTGANFRTTKIDFE